MKPSEFTPACGKLLKEMINATFEKDLVDVILGGTELAIEFSSIPWNHLLYTVCYYLLPPAFSLIELVLTIF